MCPFELGIMVPLAQFGPDTATARSSEIQAMAAGAESIGFDTT
jgi:hypothetical protein